MRTIECERCGSRYEVECILIGPEGTPIKCAHCRTVFDVFPADESKLRSPVVWIVRDTEGNTTPFSSLGVLQQMILEGTATRDWQLSRFGESWKPLGEIAGLELFFSRAGG